MLLVCAPLKMCAVKSKRMERKKKSKNSSQPSPSEPKPTATSENDNNEQIQRILQVRRLMKQRDQAREANNLVKSDELKRTLNDMGVFVRDQKGGPSGWRFLDGSSNKLPAGFKIPVDAVRHKRNREESEPPEVEATPTNRSESRVKKQKGGDGSKSSAESARNLALLRENTEAVAKSQSIGQKVVESVGITDKSVGTGPEAQQGNRVKVHYVGKLKTNGQVFDASTKKPFQFRLGAGEVIRGWDVGVKGMRVGGQRTLVIPPEKAYGRHGAPPTIPGNAWLVFDVKLLEVK